MATHPEAPFNRSSFSAEEDSIAPEFISRAPEEFSEVLSLFASIQSTPNPLAEKVTSEHIGTVLTNVDKKDERAHKERNQIRWFIITTMLFVFVFVGFLIVFLKDSPDLLVPIIASIFSFIGGFAGGYGYKSKRSPPED